MALALLVLGACHDDGSGGGAALQPAEFDVRGLSVLTDEPQLGHEIEIEAEIWSFEREEDVSVSFYMLSQPEAGGLEEGQAPGRQQLIGSAVFPVLEAGVHVYTATLVMPEDIDDDPATFEGVDDAPADGADGEHFQVFATIDPAGMFQETDEGDNHPEEGEVPVIVVDDRRRSAPDYVLQSLELDTHTVFLEDHDAQEGEPVDGIHDEEDNHLGATVEIVARGALDQVVDLSFWVVIPGQENPELAPCRDCWPLQVWDSEMEDAYELDGDGNPTEGEYTQTYEIELGPNRPCSVHLDLLIPMADDDPGPDPGEELEVSTLGMLKAAAGGEDGESYFEVRAYVDWDRSEAEYEDPDASGPESDDNMRAETIYVLLPDAEPQAGIEFWQAEESYQKDWSAPGFGAAVDLEAVARLDGRGGLARLSAGAPMTLFGSSFDLLRLEGHAQFVPHDREDSSFQIDLEFAEQVLYTQSGNLSEYQWEWSRQVAFDKSREMSAEVWVAIVPVSVRGEIGGNLGFDVVAKLGNELEHDGLTIDGIVLDGSAFVDSWARAEASVDLLIASAEARGELTFLQDRFHAASYAGVVYDPFADPVPTIGGDLVCRVTNELQGPKGRLYLEVTYPGIRWCKGLFGIPYPCGKTSEKQADNLVEWDSLHKDDVLLDFTESLSGTPALD